jgi:hypothetical protein
MARCWRWITLGMLILVVVLSTHSSQAEVKKWTSGTSGSWSGWWYEGDHWDPAGQPQSRDEVIIDIPGATCDIYYYNDLYPDAFLKSLTIDGYATFHIDDPLQTLRAKKEYIGVNALSALELKNGFNIVGELRLGVEPTGSGTYNMGTWGGLGVSHLEADYEYVGYKGEGNFTQYGGTNVLKKELYIGYGYSRPYGEVRTSTYELNHGGLLSARNQYIGWDGYGFMDHINGSNQVKKELVVGANPLSSGIYRFISGEVVAGDEFIGSQGTGVFNQFGGSNYIEGNLVLGMFDSGNGSYNMIGDFSLAYLEAASEMIGVRGSGAFVQRAPSMNIIFGDLTLGQVYGSSGSYTMESGYLEAENEFIGVHGTGSFAQYSSNAISSNKLSQDLFLGQIGTGHGTYILGGQDSTLEARHEYIGYKGVGNFLHEWGDNIVDYNLIVGAKPGSTGSYEFRAGTLRAYNVFIGQSGHGSFIQRGGETNILNNLIVGDKDTGIFELHGGTLWANYTTLGRDAGGHGTFTQWGGENRCGVLNLGYRAGSQGLYFMNDGTLNAFDLCVGVIGIGDFTHTGGTVNNGNLILAQNATSLGTYNLSGGGDLHSLSAQINPTGTLNQTGGTLSVHALDNSGNVNLSGGLAIIGPTTNQASGRLNIANDATFTGDAVNYGMVKVTGTTVTWYGTFTNLGEYSSDPATQSFKNLTVGSTGYLKGGGGDTFIISGNFINNSTQNQAWNTSAALLRFVGGGDHIFQLAGQDFGPQPSGYLNNFAWGTLELEWDLEMNQTNRLILQGEQGCALYVGGLFGLSIDDNQTVTNLISNGLNLYYDPDLQGNEYLGGFTYDLDDGGYLRPIALNLVVSGYPVNTPLPPSAWLFLSGLAGLGLLRRAKKL